MQITFRPLDVWPGTRTKSPKRGTFSVSYPKSLALLERELGYLKATNIVIQAALLEHDIRNDGMPRAGAYPRSPGIVISFDCPHGSLSYQCDTYTDWQSNIRGISLTLESLRAVERYGATKGGAQYKGYKALPAPEVSFGRYEALKWLRGLTGLANGSATVEETVRSAELKTHPDKGGNPDDFKTVQKCRAILLGR